MFRHLIDSQLGGFQPKPESEGASHIQRFVRVSAWRFSIFWHAVELEGPRHQASS